MGRLLRKTLAFGTIVAVVLCTAGSVIAQVEIVERRTLWSKHFDLGNHDILSRIYTEPVHYLDSSGTLQDIQNTIEAFNDPSGTYEYAREKGNVRLYFGASLSKGVRAEIAPDAWISLKPQGIFLKQNAVRMGAINDFENGQRAENDRKLQYLSATSGTAVELSPLTNGLLFQLQVDVNAVGDREVEYEILIEKAEMLSFKQESGRILFSASDRRLFFLSLPYVISSGSLQTILPGDVKVIAVDDALRLLVSLPKQAQANDILTIIQRLKAYIPSVTARPARAKISESISAYVSGVTQYDGGDSYGFLNSDVGQDSDPGKKGRGYLEFGVWMVPKASAQTISDTKLTVMIHGNGDPTSYKVRDYSGTWRLSWGNEAEWNKLGNDSPVFATVLTTGWAYDTKEIVDAAMQNKLQENVQQSLGWFAVGIHNQNEGENDWRKSFDLDSGTLEFKWADVKPPEIVSAIPNKSGVEVHWLSVTDATGYRIEYGQNGNYNLSVDVGTVDFYNVSVSGPSVYNFRMKAKFGSVVSGPSWDYRQNAQQNNPPSNCRTDYDFSNTIDFPDYLLFAQHWGLSEGQGGYEQRYDLSGNRTVDDPDFDIFEGDYNKSCGQVPKPALRPILANGKNQHARPGLVLRQSGTGIEVDVNIGDVVDLIGYEVLLHYDPGLVKYAGLVDAVELLEGQGGEAELEMVKDEGGLLILASALKRGYAGVAGSGLLKRIRFEPVGEVGSNPSVSLYEVSLADGERVIDRVFAQGKVAERPAAAQWETSLYANTPNPFNPSTTISFSLAEAAPVQLVVYNALGQEVRRLLSGEQMGAGIHRVVWDGRDGLGRPVASGVYLCEMRAGRFRAVQRMLMLK